MGAGKKPMTQEELIQKTADYAARKLALQQKKKLGKAKSPMSAELACTASNEEVVSMVLRAMPLYDRPHAVTDDDVCESFNWYFNEYLPQSGAFPTAEGLALSCGVNWATLNSWARGEYKSSPARGAIAQKGLAILSELDAQLVQNGKIPQVIYIFRSKNFYGMQDAVKVEHISQKEQVQSAEELDRKYADAVPVDYVPADAAEPDGDGAPD